MAKEALEEARQAREDNRVHLAACVEAQKAVKQSIDDLKAAVTRIFWWMIGLLGGVAAAVVLAFVAVLMHALVKANVL